MRVLKKLRLEQVRCPLRALYLPQSLQVSIRDYGVINPIIVQNSLPPYEILDGRLRYLAALHLHLKTIPALVLELNDDEYFTMKLHNYPSLQVIKDYLLIHPDISPRDLLLKFPTTQSLIGKHK